MAIPSNTNDREHMKFRDVGGTPSTGVSMDSRLAGEDTVNDVMKVENRNSYHYMTAAGTTTLKSTAGFLHAITIGATTAAAVLVYDSAGTSATIAAQLKASIAENTYFFDVATSNGLTIACAGTPTLTVSYR